MSGNLDYVRSKLDYEAGKNPSVIGAKNLRLRWRECLNYLVNNNLMFTKVAVSDAYDLTVKELTAANIQIPDAAFREAFLENLGRK